MNDNTTTPEKYFKCRDALLSDGAICEENRRLFRQFFEFEEYKLKRKNRLTTLDAGCMRTLNAYIYRFRNVNAWFGNRPLKKITKTDIRKVYDDLEDGKIVTSRGGRFVNRHDYYTKVFKSKLFALAGKDALAKTVIQFSAQEAAPVRFASEDSVRRLLNYVYSDHHRLLIWLSFDIGENINSLRNLVAKDFTRQSNPNTGDPEYRVNLRPEVLKRSRTPRSEITNFPETVALLDKLLPVLQPGDRLFKLTYPAAEKFLTRAGKQAGVRSEPDGQSITWKDLRSGMACDLLRKGWTRDEINKRLGHKPSSKEIDRYINFLALDGHQPKAKVHQFQVAKLEEQLAQAQSRERANGQRLSSVESELDFLRARWRDLAAILQANPTLAELEMALAIKERTRGNPASDLLLDSPPKFLPLSKG
jgi:hypothetical protein